MVKIVMQIQVMGKYNKRENILSTAEVLSCSRAERLEDLGGSISSFWTKTSEEASSHLNGVKEETPVRWNRILLVRMDLQKPGRWEEDKFLVEEEFEADLNKRASNLAPEKLVETAIWREALKPERRSREREREKWELETKVELFQFRSKNGGAWWNGRRR